MAENKINTEKVGNDSSKHAIVGTPGSFAAPTTALAQLPPLELLVRNSHHPIRPYLVEAVQLARRYEGEGEESIAWECELSDLMFRHVAVIEAYLEAITKVSTKSWGVLGILGIFVHQLADGDYPGYTYIEEEAALLLIHRLEVLIAKHAPALRPGPGSYQPRPSVFPMEDPSDDEASVSPPAGRLSSASPRGVDKTCKSCEKLGQERDVTARQIATILASLDVPRFLQNALQDFLNFGR